MSGLFTIRDGVVAISGEPEVPANPMGIALTGLCFLQLASHVVAQLNLPEHVAVLKELEQELPSAFR
jgi:hypothetical protein